MPVAKPVNASSMNGYSLLEILLVTTFVIIFMVVVNPGTYIDRFSGILLKMSVLNESMVVVNKLNTVSMSHCRAQALQPQSFSYKTHNQSYALQLQTDISIQNSSTGAQGVLLQYLDPSSVNDIEYYSGQFALASDAESLRYADMVVHSSLMEHRVLVSFLCDDQHLSLRAY
jgi:hypothetical protein